MEDHITASRSPVDRGRVPQIPPGYFQRAGEILLQFGQVSKSLAGRVPDERLHRCSSPYQAFNQMAADEAARSGHQNQSAFPLTRARAIAGAARFNRHILLR